MATNEIAKSDRYEFEGMEADKKETSSNNWSLIVDELDAIDVCGDFAADPYDEEEVDYVAQQIANPVCVAKQKYVPRWLRNHLAFLVQIEQEKQEYAEKRRLWLLHNYVVDTKEAYEQRRVERMAKWAQKGWLNDGKNSC